MPRRQHAVPRGEGPALDRLPSHCRSPAVLRGDSFVQTVAFETAQRRREDNKRRAERKTAAVAAKVHGVDVSQALSSATPLHGGLDGSNPSPLPMRPALSAALLDLPPLFGTEVESESESNDASASAPEACRPHAGDPAAAALPEALRQGLRAAETRVSGAVWVLEGGHRPPDTVWVYGMTKKRGTTEDLRCMSGLFPVQLTMPDPSVPRAEQRTYASVEHYVQACKFAPTSKSDHDAVAAALSGGAAARLGQQRSRPLRPDWELVKERIALAALCAKFAECPLFRETLMNTGHAVVVQHSQRDKSWSDGGDGSGQNRMGILLMAVREAARLARVGVPTNVPAHELFRLGTVARRTLPPPMPCATRSSFSLSSDDGISTDAASPPAQTPVDVASGEFPGTLRGRCSGTFSRSFTREPTMRHGRSEALVGSPDRHRLYTVVLDLDETIIYGREEKLLARTYLKDFLRRVSSVAELIVWTAGDRDYAKSVVREINISGAIQHLVYRDSNWFAKEDYTKDLKRLGRDMKRTLIVENTPDCVRLNPTNGIIVSDYEGETGGRTDATLQKVAGLVEELVSSGESVQDFLKACPLVRPQEVEGTDGKPIPIYFVSSRLRKPVGADGVTASQASDETKTVKVNRDKAAPPANESKKRGRSADSA